MPLITAEFKGGGVSANSAPKSIENNGSLISVLTVPVDSVLTTLLLPIVPASTIR